MNLNHVVVLDLETSSIDIENCQILQVACMPIDMVLLKPMPELMFSSLVRPEDPSTISSMALIKTKLKLEELEKAPPVSVVIKNLNNHMRNMFKTKSSSSFVAPYLAGKNIQNFDIPILTRYCKRFNLVDGNGEPKMFNRKWFIDIEDDLFRWFGQTGILENLSMDTIRDYFGIPKENAHNANQDVHDTAWLIIKFLNLYRTLAKKVSFKGSYENS